MICVLGDLHLRSDKDYFIETCKKFISWFSTWKYNTKGNNLILAGDLVEQAAPGGLTISFLEQFINASRFDSVHICVGNHDEKKINCISQLAYEFLNEKPNVFIYKKATEICIENKKILVLPYYVGINELGLVMNEYYSSLYKNRAFRGNHDLIVGHFAGEDCSFAGAPDCIQNLDKLKGRLCLGHIHVRDANPSRYIGSVFACRKNENDSTRAAWILGDDDVIEDRLPMFNEFLTVSYPNPLPSSNALVPIYTISNCGNESTAKSLYGDIFIRKITASSEDVSLAKKEFLERQFLSIKDINMLDLFKDFLSSRETPFSTEVVKECNSALEKFVIH
jgi:hypothetical protein